MTRTQENTKYRVSGGQPIAHCHEFKLQLLSMTASREPLPSSSSSTYLPPNDSLPKRFKVLWRILLISNFALSGSPYYLLLVRFPFSSHSVMGYFSLIRISILNFPDPETTLGSEKMEFVMKRICMLNVFVFARQVFDVMTVMDFFA